MARPRESQASWLRQDSDPDWLGDLSEVLAPYADERGEIDDRLVETLTDATRDALIAVAGPAGEAIARSLRMRAPVMLARRRRKRRAFERRLRRYWGEALDRFYEVYVCCQEVGDGFNNEFRPDAAQDQDHRFQALVFVQARACLTASEVFALLRTGHPTGAIARWRTLHELHVVSEVLSSAPGEVAEAYLLHEVFDEVKDLEDYDRRADEEGWERVDPVELAQLRQSLGELVGRFPAGFDRDWGWASPLLPPGQRPTFYALEKLAGLGYRRPVYRLASHRVHAGSKGNSLARLLFRGDEVLLVGPHNYGLEDAGIGAAASLVLTTVNLLTHGRPEGQGLMVGPAIRALHLLQEGNAAAWEAAAHGVDEAEKEAHRAEDGGILAAYGIALIRAGRQSQRTMRAAARHLKARWHEAEGRSR